MGDTTLRGTWPTPGDSAPDVELPTSEGTSVHLSDYWTASQQGLVLVFLRHFGCLFCREHARGLRDAYQQFIDRGYQVVAIGNGTVKRAAAFKAEFNIPYPLLADGEHVAYAAYGLGKAPLSDLLRPAVIAAGVRAVSRGHFGGVSQGDPAQLPGTFIIDPGRTVRYAKPADHAGDLAPPAALIAWIDSHSQATVPYSTAAAAD